MLSTACEGVGAEPGRSGAEPVAESQSDGHEDAQDGEGRREGFGVQDWSDGSRYEGDFVDGYKHGRGRYTWKNGEYYEGSFYKDYRHGDGIYCWPTGHKFLGMFYLNRKEGYGQQLFPDGAIFQGLYHADQRFGPGVISYPDGHQDVGLWLGEYLLRLCTSVEEGFSLKNLPEYAAYMGPAAITDPLTQPPILSSGMQIGSREDAELHTDRDLLSDENSILPPGIESYSTDGDHLPLPPGRRKELDQHFYGELWEPDPYQYQGYQRDPFSNLPLQARMQTHIHKHRLQGKNVNWNVASVLALSRKGFGPKGPLEVTSERLIHHASRGELQAVSQILQTGLVHPDIADSQGHTALIAATVNCHNDVIQLLLDMGADIDMLNSEGMSALAVCHVLYYPFHSLHTTMAELAKHQVLESPSECANRLQISQVGLTMETHRLDNGPQTCDTALSNQTTHSHLSDQTDEELTRYISHHSSKVSNDSEHWPHLYEDNPPTDTEHVVEEGEGVNKEAESEEEVGEGEENSHKKCVEEREREERNVMEEHDQRLKIVERVAVSETGDMELREDTEPDEENKLMNMCEEDVEEREERGSGDVLEVDCSIQVLDGHIALGSVQWNARQAKAARELEQGKNRELAPNQSFDSARAVSGYKIHVTKEVMQRSAEALSRTGIPQRLDTQETVRKMAAMKIEHRARWNTLKLLLDRGADPNLSKVPMPVLFMAVMAADIKSVRQLLLCGAQTDITLPPERKGLYPLHIAASLPGEAGPRITELLLHAITNPDAQACDQDEIYELDYTQEPKGPNKSPNPKEGGRTALHVACQRVSDYQNASKVVALLLSHRASTDLLWSGHSPLSLAIASGNDLAVEELLNGGADPNIPLGPGVGSALCALANINYPLNGNRTKLLDMLAKAGADILMPVPVGDVMGTAVDYAHYSFNQDLRIAHTPFHALNLREREVFKTRRQLLKGLGDLLRQTAAQREKTYLEGEKDLKLNAVTSDGPLLDCKSQPQITEKDRKVFKFCYYCGCSVFVKLTACSRCRKVFYCSRACTLKAWDERHKEECIRASASTDGIQKRVVFKSKKGPRLMTTMPLSVKVKPQRVPTPSRTAENIPDSIMDLKENYSMN
ncbi:ankyrin repeat and MYND domain-containing protein 1 [Channa argus]|uniref:ankyrin repeat and MYND domain-containing protein 1 n=1 Tax=Channa argus TaxID=215402 RepID=UPI00351F85AB